jgi:formylglycine-generating enzyme required for sulfatase activity
LGCGKAASETHEIGTKAASLYGLFDMRGNMREGVEDWYALAQTLRQVEIDEPGVFAVAPRRLRSARRLRAAAST